MVQNLVTTLGRFLNLVIGLAVAGILSVLAWGSWQYYFEATQQDEFAQKGSLVTVPVTQASQQQRSWQDMISNSTYLTIDYRGKAYTCRFVMDRGYVGSGDRVKLLYHPGYDAFRQPGYALTFRTDLIRSRLLAWSTIWTVKAINKLLLLCLLLSAAAFFCLRALL